jgi:transposase InsO family protein
MAPFSREDRVEVCLCDSGFIEPINRRAHRRSTIRVVWSDKVLTSFRAPPAIAIADRVVATLRRGCLDHVLVRPERHLRRILRKYVAFYNAAHSHQALGQVPPAADRASGGLGARLVGEAVLGGLNHV